MGYNDLLDKKYLMSVFSYKKKFSIFLTWVLFILITTLLASCGSKSFYKYNGLQITRIDVFKSKRILIVYHNDKVIKIT